MAKSLMVLWIIYCASHWGVEPEFALAVAHVESRIGKQEFRVDRLGQTNKFGPFGIPEDFLKRWPIDQWPVNCWIGVKALRGKNQKKVLKRYNANFDGAYWQAIQRAKRKYAKLFK